MSSNDAGASCVGRSGADHGHPGLRERRPDRRRLGVVGRHDGRGTRGRGGEQCVEAPHRGAGIGDHQEATGGEESPPLAHRVRGLDTCPWLEQRNRRGGGLLVDGDQEPFARPGLDHHPLVDDDVFLEPALEVVAEGRVGAGRREVAVVGLDEDPLADPVVRDALADRDDPGDDLVPRDRGRLAGDVARDLRERLRREAADHLALAGMVREGVQQLGVREADADGLDAQEDLRGPRGRHRLGPVVDGLARGHDLDGVLGGRDGDAGGGGLGHCGGSSAMGQLSMTWPPVTGSACPVSYCWATR